MRQEPELKVSAAVNFLAAPLLESHLAAPEAAAFVEVFQTVIDGLPEQVALLDESWKILTVNDAWIKTASGVGYDDLMPGHNYLSFCSAMGAEGHPPAAQMADGIAEIEAGRRQSLHLIYRGRDQWEGHAFQIHLNRLQMVGQTYAIVTRQDVTELVQLRELREGFSQSLIEGQADERRRIAREIHDSTMQLLAGLSLALGQLKRVEHSDATVGIVHQMEELLAEVLRELRSISYLAHPPALRELNLKDAVGALVEGFGRRDGLNVSVHVDVGDTTLPRPIEQLLYRVVQEAISNIHRHSHATEAAVAVIARPAMIHAIIADDGTGIAKKIRHSVGLPSMRARLSELNGRLTIRSGDTGTILIASLPVQTHLRAVGDLAENA